MNQLAREQVAHLVIRACEKAAAAGELPGAVWPSPTVEFCGDPGRGDLTTPFCLAAAGVAGMAPRPFADILLPYMDLKDSCFTAVAAAGPGYLNFRLGDKWYADTLRAVEQEGEHYGSCDELAGQTVAIQLTGDTSWATNLRRDVVLAALTNLLIRCGAEVARDTAANNYVNRVTVPVAACQLRRGGQPVDKALPLSALPADAVGFLLSARPDRAVTVDLEQASREDRSNPFYCARYIHRRMGSLLQGAERQGYSLPHADDADLSALQSGADRLLIKLLACYPDVVVSAARTRNPGAVTAYLTDLSDALWAFYQECRSVDFLPPALPVRLVLADAGRAVMGNVLTLLGIRI